MSRTLVRAAASQLVATEQVRVVTQARAGIRQLGATKLVHVYCLYTLSAPEGHHLPSAPPTLCTTHILRSDFPLIPFLINKCLHVDGSSNLTITLSTAVAPNAYTFGWGLSVDGAWSLHVGWFPEAVSSNGPFYEAGYTLTLPIHLDQRNAPIYGTPLPPTLPTGTVRIMVYYTNGPAVTISSDSYILSSCSGSVPASSPSPSTNMLPGSTQPPQTGLLYWCSFIEGGANMATQGSTAGMARTTTNAAQTYYSGPCHLPYTANGNLPYIQYSAIAYTYSNGTAYPQNGATVNCQLFPYCPYNIAPSSCMTADNWATDPLQCAVPGFGNTPLYANNGGTNPISSFPITYDQKLACNNAVYTSTLVDTTNAAYVYGQLYAWKVG